MFDRLHALGLAIAISECEQVEVHMCDIGAAFSVTPEKRKYRKQRACTISDILTVQTAMRFDKATKLQLGNLDGLLAATFTMPGARLVSVADIKAKLAKQPEAYVNGISKVTGLIKRIDKSIARGVKGTGDWLPTILEDYRSDRALPPEFRANDKQQLTLTLPLDPAFGYGTRQPTSDGLISRKAAISMKSPRAGGPLAYIGAARYLRAQRTKGSAVLLFVPMITDLRVQPGAVATRLPSVSMPVEQAVYTHWLGSWRGDHKSSDGLAVHALQAQGAKQSISVNRIELPFSPLNRLADRGFGSLIKRWEQQLKRNQDGAPVDNDSLLDMLRAFGATSIQRYLMDTVRWRQTAPAVAPEYRFEEIKAMIDLHPKTGSAMAQIVERKNGTLRFGQAIRLLSEQNRSASREIVEDLETVQNQDQLLRVLARSIQKCVLAKASTDFILVPTEEDLAALLDDVAQFSPKEIAGLLIILSAVWYPRVAESSGQILSHAVALTKESIQIEEKNHVS